MAIPVLQWEAPSREEALSKSPLDLVLAHVARSKTDAAPDCSVYLIWFTAEPSEVQTTFTAKNLHTWIVSSHGSDVDLFFQNKYEELTTLCRSEQAHVFFCAMQLPTTSLKHIWQKLHQFSQAGRCPTFHLYRTKSALEPEHPISLGHLVANALPTLAAVKVNSLVKIAVMRYTVAQDPDFEKLVQIYSLQLEPLVRVSTVSHLDALQVRVPSYLNFSFLQFVMPKHVFMENKELVQLLKNLALQNLHPAPYVGHKHLPPREFFYHSIRLP